MATVDELLRMQAEMQAEEQARAAAGLAPGEEPDPDDPLMDAARAAVAEQVISPRDTGAATTGFVDPFAEFDDPFVEFDEPGDLGPVNPFADFPSDFPMEPGTSRASQELGEMFVPPVETPASIRHAAHAVSMGMIPKETEAWPSLGTAELVGPGRTTPETGTGVGSTFSDADAAMVASAAVTMTDPEEIAQMLRQFPEIGITYAPDGAIIATNNETGARGLINRPGISGMDILQTLGLAAAFAPSGRIAGWGLKAAPTGVTSATMRQQAQKEATRRAGWQAAGTMGATQAAIEGQHALAGGEFDPEDIAFTAGAGKVGEHLAAPLATAATKTKEIFGRVVEVVPRNVQQALDFAESTGRKIYTSDALSEFMTPIQRIFLKSVERIPITGIGRQRNRQKAARTDALIDLANKYDIDITTELGQDIADNFIDRMIKQRFWGKNKEMMDPENWPSGVTNPQGRREAEAKAQELLERAFHREADEVVDQAVAKQLRQGNLDEEIVERILDGGNRKRLNDMWGRLMPEGQKMVQQRFLTRGLERAGWTPDSPQIADPDKFVDYLTDPKNKKALQVFFNEGERDLIEGTREYLRMTTEAAQTGQGAGMVAAVGGSSAVGLAMLNSLYGVALGTALSGRAIQSGPVRDLLLKLTYAKGDLVKQREIMAQLRPYVSALQNQYFESGGPPPVPEIDFSKDLMKQASDYGMEYLRSLGEQGMEKFEDVTQGIGSLLTFEE